MLYHDHAQSLYVEHNAQAARYSGVQCKNTETNIFVYGGKRVNITGKVGIRTGIELDSCVVCTPGYTRYLILWNWSFLIPGSELSIIELVSLQRFAHLILAKSSLR